VLPAWGSQIPVDRHFSWWSLLTFLHSFRVANIGVIGVQPEFAVHSSLAEEIPTPFEGDLEFLDVPMSYRFQVVLLGQFYQRGFFGAMLPNVIENSPIFDGGPSLAVTFRGFTRMYSLTGRNVARPDLGRPGK